MRTTNSRKSQQDISKTGRLHQAVDPNVLGATSMPRMTILAPFKSAKFLALIVVAIVLNYPALAHTPPNIRGLLAQVPDNASWQTLPADLRADFERHADAILQKDRSDWGAEG